VRWSDSSSRRRATTSRPCPSATGSPMTSASRSPPWWPWPKRKPCSGASEESTNHCNVARIPASSARTTQPARRQYPLEGLAAVLYTAGSGFSPGANSTNGRSPRGHTATSYGAPNCSPTIRLTTRRIRSRGDWLPGHEIDRPVWRKNEYVRCGSGGSVRCPGETAPSPPLESAR
jgi:hypothetical protein